MEISGVTLQKPDVRLIYARAEQASGDLRFLDTDEICPKIRLHDGVAINQG